MVLNGSSSLLLHRLQDAALIAASLFFLPLNTFFLIASYALSSLLPSRVNAVRHQIRSQPNFKPRTILVTGVEQAKGLCLARLFYEAGHDVIGTGFSHFSCGKYSVALKKFYHLEKPLTSDMSAIYIQNLIDIIEENGVELWVSCSRAACAMDDGQAKEMIEARTDCKAIQFNIKDTQMLHEKHSFMEHTAQLGLVVPETHTITSQAQAAEILRNSTPGRKFIMKYVGILDSARSDMTLLPLSSMQATENFLSQREITPKSRWILQQFISGPELCTHALVVRGQVKVFVTCMSADVLMHYETMPPNSVLSQKMLEFTKTYAEDGGKDFTGHLSFDFMLEDGAINNPETAVLYPIECNPRAHTAVVLLSKEAPAVVDAYLSLLKTGNETINHQAEPVIPRDLQKCYWVGHDLFELVLLPTLSFLLLQNSLSNLLGTFQTFLTHLLFWKDGTYMIWDPLPSWCLYQVYWPLQFWLSFKAGKKWSRINVSTTKMFDC